MQADRDRISTKQGGSWEAIVIYYLYLNGRGENILREVTSMRIGKDRITFVVAPFAHWGSYRDFFFSFIKTIENSVCPLSWVYILTSVFAWTNCTGTKDP